MYNAHYNRESTTKYEIELLQQKICILISQNVVVNLTTNVKDHKKRAKDKWKYNMCSNQFS